MRVDFHISNSERGNFHVACEAAIRNVGGSTKAAVEEAAFEIMSESMAQVPVDTGALIQSAFVGIAKRSNIKSSSFGAVLGYGSYHGIGSAIGPTVTKGGDKPGAIPELGIGTYSVDMSVGLGGIEWMVAPRNVINPKTGLPADSYAPIVHEDLNMPHPNGGKAKFLEDPINEWAAGRFSRVAQNYWRTAISYINHSYNFRRIYHRNHEVTYKLAPYKSTKHTLSIVSSRTLYGKLRRK